jgi:hypothetical protein
VLNCATNKSFSCFCSVDDTFNICDHMNSVHQKS